MIEYLPLFLSLVATGILAGILAGLLGVGGGIVIVPVLYFVFQYLGMDSIEAMSLATGTSLATIVPTSISSIRSHNHRGNVDWSLIKSWWFWIFIGVLLGAALIAQFKSMLFVLLFSIIAALVALRMLFHKTQAGGEKLTSKFIQKWIASSIGFFSVMIGIGGGTIGVPILTKFNFVAQKAVGTAAVFGFIIALPGALMMLMVGVTPLHSPVGTYGLVNIPSFLTIVPLTVIFAPVGVKIAQKLDASTLKKVFAVVLLITSARMFSQAIGV